MAPVGSMDGTLHVVTVGSPADERALLRALSGWERAPAARAVPARAAELDRLRALAQRCEREAVTGSLKGGGLDALAGDASADEGHVPDLLVVGPSVDPSLEGLASVLCRRGVVRLEDLAAGRAEPHAGAATAMLLWSPDDTPAGTTIAALEALTERGVRVGLMPCFGADSDRWALLKALTFPLLPNRGRQRVLSSSPLDSANAPGCVGEAREIPSILRRPLDVLAFEGHGNPQDLFVGRNAILCARQGRGAGATPGAGLFPCYHDGVCFRRAFRLPDAELIPGDALDALLLFAVTCYYVQLGKSSFSQASGLAPQIMRGPAVAVISSPAVVWSYTDLSVLGLCLVHEGRPLSEVAHALDWLQRESIGLSTGLPKNAPSVALFGNPCARLRPLGIKDAVVVGRDGPALIAETPAATPGLGAFVRVALDGSDREVRTWSLEGLAPRAWARGARLKGEAGERLYLWLGEQAVAGRDTLRLAPLAPPDVELKTLRDFIEAFDFWPLFLDYCLEVREGRNSNVGLIERALKSLPRWQRGFTRMLFDASPPYAPVLVNANAGSRLGFVHALTRMREFSAAVLDLCADILAFDGFNDIGTYAPLLNGESDLTSGPCACGQCELQTHQWVPPSGPRPVAYRHACACASAGTDSCRYDVRWKSSPLTARLAEPLRLSLALSAPPDRHLAARAAAVLVRPTHDRRISGPHAELLLAPGETGELACEVVVPADVPPGVHEVSVIAIVNGSLVQRSYMAELLAPARPRSRRAGAREATAPAR
jgi:hypothetical protein